MKKLINKIVYVLPLAFLYGCEPEFDDIEFSQGGADFSTMVAVGNSLTAGYQSNALSAEGQKYSLPNIIAEQMKQVGGGEFTQPLLTGEAGQKGVGVNPQLLLANLVTPELSLTYTTSSCGGSPSLGPALVPQGRTNGVPNAAYSASSFLAPIGQNGPYNNVGIPGAKSYHLLADGYGNAQNLPTGRANPYYVRFVNPSDVGETPVEAALRTNPTFFSLWIGNNDVLGYATGGGDQATDTITAAGFFAGAYQGIAASLSSNGTRKGVVANIPDVTSIPYFTTVPIGTDAVSSAQAQQLNAAYAAYNAALDGAVAIAAQKPWINFSQAEADNRKINFQAGRVNTFIVLDPALKDLTDTAYTSVDPNFAGALKFRQIKAGEYLTLTTPGDSLQCGGWGTAKPIPAEYHLTAAEIKKVSDAITAYNNTIRSVANQFDLAFVDANSVLKELASTGITVNGIEFNSELVSGGAFSLDGVHPSSRGYAIIANEFIGAINAKYGSNIPKVDVGTYPALEVVN